MLPSYTIYKVLDHNDLEIKEGTQLISVLSTLSIYAHKVSYLQGTGIIPTENFMSLMRGGYLKEIVRKGSNTPISQVHPEILKFYQDQLGLSNHYTTSDIKEVRNMFGQQYISDSLSRIASTIHAISDSMEPTIIPTIVGKAWYDFVVSMENVGNLAIIPAIIEELSKVTLKELEGKVNHLEVEITDYYKIYFDILSVIGKVVILKIRLLEPA